MKRNLRFKYSSLLYPEQAEPTGVAASSNGHPSSQELILPPPEGLIVLRDLSRQGNMQAIRQPATKLSEIDEKYTLFIVRD